MKFLIKIIRVKDKPHIFGGYTEATWEGNGIYKQDKNAFLFSLVNSEKKPVKLKIYKNFGNAIYCSSAYGPTFGNNHDLCITSYSNISSSNHCTNFGSTYPHLTYPTGSNEAKTFLAGSNNFSTSEIEVYQLIKSNSNS